VKYDPISNRERARIIHQVSHGEAWQGTRAGRRVRISLAVDLMGKHVLYAVCIQRRWLRGSAATISEAVDACNATIRGRRSA